MIIFIALMVAVLVGLMLYCLAILKDIESEVRALMRFRRLDNQNSRMWYSAQAVTNDRKPKEN